MKTKAPSYLLALLPLVLAATLVGTLVGAPHRAHADRVDDLSVTLETDKSDKARIAAAVGLGRLADSRGVPALIRALTDENATVRGVACSALGHIGDARAIPALEKTLADESEAVRSRARDALVLLRERHARESGGGAVDTATSTRRRSTPKESARAAYDEAEPKLFVVVQTASNRTTNGGKPLGLKMKEVMLAALAHSPEVTLDAAVGKNNKLKQFTIDGAITQLKRIESGKWVEVFCEVKITVSNEKGRMVGIVTGTATLQLAKSAYRNTMEKNLLVEAMENAVNGAHQNLLGYLARQLASN